MVKDLKLDVGRGRDDFLCYRLASQSEINVPGLSVVAYWEQSVALYI